MRRLGLFGLVVCFGLLTTDTVDAQSESTLRIEFNELADVPNPEVVKGDKADGTVPQTILIDPADAGAHQIGLQVFLDSRIAACLDGETVICTGGENFFDGVNYVFGCADEIDNDGNGIMDSEDPDCNGVQGWSMSIETGACFAIRSSTTGPPPLRGATTRGTLSDLSTNGGLRDPSGSFEKTERIDPTNPANGGSEGAVSAVVLAFTNPVVLNQVSSSQILLLRGDSDTTGLGEGDTTPPCNISILDPAAEGFSGSGEPVKTAVTVSGETALPAICNLSYQIEIKAPPPAPEFIRGDANDDGRVDIGDSVWIVNEIFYSGPSAVCQDAADANDDADVVGNPPDVSDVVYLTEYLYMAGSAPPAPGSSCGVDPSDDGLSCEASATSCTGA